MGARRLEASFISVHVVFPVFPLMNVREAEFPVFIRLIDALQEALSLFLFRQMKEYFERPGSVVIKVALQARDGAICSSQMVFPWRSSSASPWPRRISGCTRTTSTSS